MILSAFENLLTTDLV